MGEAKLRQEEIKSEAQKRVEFDRVVHDITEFTKEPAPLINGSQAVMVGRIMRVALLEVVPITQDAHVPPRVRGQFVCEPEVLVQIGQIFQQVGQNAIAALQAAAAGALPNGAAESFGEAFNKPQ